MIDPIIALVIFITTYALQRYNQCYLKIFLNRSSFWTKALVLRLGTIDYTRFQYSNSTLNTLIVLLFINNTGLCRFWINFSIESGSLNNSKSGFKPNFTPSSSLLVINSLIISSSFSSTAKCFPWTWWTKTMKHITGIERTITSKVQKKTFYRLILYLHYIFQQYFTLLNWEQGKFNQSVRGYWKKQIICPVLRPLNSSDSINFSSEQAPHSTHAPKASKPFVPYLKSPS